MVHLDHSLLPTHPSSQPTQQPTPATPILASHLLALEASHRQRFQGKGRTEELSTGCREVDDILGGGVERGIVLGVSAGEEGEGRVLSLNILASALLPHLTTPSAWPPSTPKTHATIIDTTGSFSLPLLASILRARIVACRLLITQNAVSTGNFAVRTPEKGGGRSRDGDGDGEEEVEKMVMRCLEMVALCRVFDVEGLWEVLGEVGSPSSLLPKHQGDDTAQVEQHNLTSKTKPAEIPDSDDEHTPEEVPTEAEEEEQDEDDGTEIIIVDNMTHIINELFSRKEKSEAHTLLTLLSTTTHTLSSTKNILTILHNTTTSTVKLSSHLNAQNPAHVNQNRNQNSSAQTNPKSIFASTTQKPSLGQIFAQFPALHLFLHRLPRDREDAEILYGQPSPELLDAVNYCTVVEVLKDETPAMPIASPTNPAGQDDRGSRTAFAYREQRWTAVELTPSGTGLVGAFQDKGVRGGMGLERDRGQGYNRDSLGRGLNPEGAVDGGLSGYVGGVAKIWGFGGRRV